MKIYITKYALTSGIKEVEISPDKLSSDVVLVGDWNNYCHKGEWHKSYAEALVRANEMRQAKIKSLKRSLSKLEAMKFEKEN